MTTKYFSLHFLWTLTKSFVEFVMDYPKSQSFGFPNVVYELMETLQLPPLPPMPPWIFTVHRERWTLVRIKILWKENRRKAVEVASRSRCYFPPSRHVLLNRLNVSHEQSNLIPAVALDWIFGLRLEIYRNKRCDELKGIKHRTLHPLVPA